MVRTMLKSANTLQIKTTFRRDLAEFPLGLSESGESTNPQDSVCNNFNHRFTMSGQDRIYSTELKPSHIVQHYMVSDFEGTVKAFTTGVVSAHYVITKDGIVEEFVHPDLRAYHAGIGGLKYGSKMNPEISSDKNFMNSWSIGIENIK